MSEVLAQLEKKGGEDFDFSKTPDALYRNSDMAYNATATLAVTKKPKWLVVCCVSIEGYNSFFMGIINVEKNTAYRYGYWADANHDEEWSNPSTYITSITDSSISIKNNYGSRCNVRVGAYY